MVDDGLERISDGLGVYGVGIILNTLEYILFGYQIRSGYESLAALI